MEVTAFCFPICKIYVESYEVLFVKCLFTLLSDGELNEVRYWMARRCDLCCLAPYQPCHQTHFIWGVGVLAQFIKLKLGVLHPIIVSGVKSYLRHQSSFLLMCHTLGFLPSVWLLAPGLDAPARPIDTFGQYFYKD